MDYASGRMLRGWNVPQFFNADTVNLRLTILIQRKLRLEQFGEMATHAFGKECVFCMQFHAAHIIGFMAAIARNAHIARRDTPDRAIGVVENFCGRKTGKNFYAQIFSLPRQPSAHITKRAGICALVMHKPGHQEMRYVELAGLGQKPVLIVIHRRIGQRTAQLAPVRQQLVKRLGINDRTGQYVRAHLGTFFKDADAGIGG